MMQQRDITLDYMKCIAIFMVVFGHVISCTDVELPILRNVIYSIHMPIFFFVSGYLVNKKLISYKDVLLFLQKKIRILIPFVVIGGGNFLIHKHNIVDFFIDWEKNGYWFLWTLFLMFVIYAITNALLVKNKNILIEIVVLMVPVPICMLLRMYEASEIGQLLNFLNLYNYLFFISGVIVARFNLRKYILNDLSQFVFFVIYIVGLISEFALINLPMKLCGVLFLYGLLADITKSAQESNNIKKLILYIGRSSLGIYVLHYFIYRGLGPLPDPWYDYISSSVLLITIVSFIITSCIIFVSLILFEVLKYNKYVRMVVLGLK